MKSLVIFALASLLLIYVAFTITACRRKTDAEIHNENHKPVIVCNDIISGNTRVVTISCGCASSENVAAFIDKSDREGWVLQTIANKEGTKFIFHRR